MSVRKKTAILISGNGSNMAALVAAAQAPDYPAEIALVICNVPGAGGIARAQSLGVPVKVISHKEFDSRENFDTAVDAALRDAQIELICEAGFMRIHSAWFAERWEGRILNIHPSLLPAFPGIRVHEQVLAAGEKESGCTVHFLTPELDSGPIVLQAKVPVLPGDTKESLAARVQIEEHKIYPEALKLVASGNVSLKDGKAIFV